MRKHDFSRIGIFIVLMSMTLFVSACVRTKLEVRAVPPEAYVYLDGTPIGDSGRSGDHNLRLHSISPGEHTVGVYAYGYKPEVRKVTIPEQGGIRLDIPMTPVGGNVSGPWGRIQIEGGHHSAVLLNGTSPEYLVGNADQFNHDISWKQELLVPPGTHQLTLLDRATTVWSGPVTVGANERVIVNVGKGGEQKTDAWPRGQQLSSVPRFSAGTASSTVAVGKPTAQISSSAGQIACAGSSRLTWSSTDAVGGQISGLGDVAASGEREVQPKETTTYTLTATGPGGNATANTTVNVDKAVQASLTVSPEEIRYRRKGDKVLEQGTATLAWSAVGADSASLAPFGSVSAPGSRTLQATPRKTDPGPVDETVTYTLRVGNACGGSETRTATLRITGVIEPAISPVETTLEARLSATSVYFPTALPSKRDPNGGLVPSQQQSLGQLASDFKQYLQFRPDARLIFQAHADSRGSKASNQALSERRSNRAKQYLIDQGVPAANLEMVAYGSGQNLTESEVKQLIESNPELTDQDRKKLMRNWRSVLLLQNRRVDIMLSTTKQQSKRYFPLNAADFKELVR
jgi:outer membrane protein OmpA-like peptidoglycan-associated protein